MTASVQGDRVRCFTSTTGTGTVTVGSKYSNSFLTPAEAGIANNAQVTYALEEDGDFEIARGVYSTSGPTITRATVLVSSIGGTVGTSKMDLQGSAQIRIVLSAADINDILTTYAPLASPTFTGTPAAPTAAGGTNTTQIATTAFVKSEVDALVAAAPGALDTLDELAAALGDDPNFATTVTNALATKASLTGAETLTNKTLTAPKFADLGFIADANGNELLIFDSVTSAVNEITIGNAATGNKPFLAATGETNIGLDLTSNGTGGIVLWAGSKARELLILTNVASAVNEFTISPAASGSGPILEATGSDTNIPITLKGKGTGAVILGQSTSTDVRLAADQPIGDSSGNELIKFTKTTSAVNEITVLNNSTGNNPKISATGGDSNIALVLVGKGTQGVWADNAFYGKAVTLSDGATPALDASLGNFFVLSAAGNRTIAVPTNPQGNGQTIVIAHLASGGARTLALNTGTNGFKFGTDITALTATGSGLWDYITCRWNATAAKWHVLGVIKGF